MSSALSPLRMAVADARAGTDGLFALIRPDAWHDRPVVERHRLIFYLGHLEAFDWNLFREAAGLASFHPSFDRLFAFGIDPEPGQLPQDQRCDWPEVDEVHRYNRDLRGSLDALLGEISEELLSVALEHRLMHAETFMVVGCSRDCGRLPSSAEHAPAACRFSKPHVQPSCQPQTGA